MHQDESLKLFTKIFKTIGTHWKELIQELKDVSDLDDQSQVYLEDFIKIVEKFKSGLTMAQILSIAKAFPGK